VILVFLVTVHDVRAGMMYLLFVNGVVRLVITILRISGLVCTELSREHCGTSDVIRLMRVDSAVIFLLFSLIFLLERLNGFGFGFFVLRQPLHATQWTMISPHSSPPISPAISHHTNQP